MPNSGSSPPRRARAEDAHQQSEDNGVDQALGVLAVVNGAHARDHQAQSERQAGRNARVRRPVAGVYGGAATRQRAT